MKVELTQNIKNINDLIESLWENDEIWADDKPTYMLRGTGWDWFFCPNTNTMDRLRRGLEIVPINNPENGKVACMYNTQVYLIPEDEIICYGWN